MLRLGIARALHGFCPGNARALLRFCLGMLRYARVCLGILGFCSGIAWVLLGYSSHIFLLQIMCHWFCHQFLAHYSSIICWKQQRWHFLKNWSTNEVDFSHQKLSRLKKGSLIFVRNPAPRIVFATAILNYFVTVSLGAPKQLYNW